MPSETVQALTQIVAPLVPGYLALFDIADFKRRNFHLGHLTGDQDIAEFEALAQEMLAGRGVWQRIFGGRWCAFVPLAHLPVLAAIMRAFRQRTLHQAGWECRARTPDGAQLHSAEYGPVLLHRALRCGYLLIESTSDLNASLEALQAGIWRLPIDAVATVPDRSLPILSPRWTCVEGNVPSSLYCPACGGTAFTWTGGAEDTDEGICRTCEAEVDFRSY